MGREPATKDDYLWMVYERAQFAARERSRVVEAMVWARQAGATDEEIAEVSGLSVAAIGHYIRYYERRRARETYWVGRPPRKRRTRGGAPGER